MREKLFDLSPPNKVSMKRKNLSKGTREVLNSVSGMPGS